MFIGTLARWKEDKKYFPDALNRAVDFLFKSCFDLQHFLPAVNRMGMNTISNRHVYKTLFQYAETGGQRQRVTQLHEPVIIIVDSALNELFHEAEIFFCNIKSSDRSMDILNHKSVRNADLRRLFPSPFHTETVAVDQVAFGAHPGISSDIVQQSEAVCQVCIHTLALGCDISAGKGDKSGMFCPVSRILPACPC